MLMKHLFIKKHISYLNIGGVLLVFFVNLIVGFTLIPFLIAQLGVVQYGLIALSFSALAYLGIMTNSLLGPINRTFVAKETDTEERKKLFFTAWCIVVAAGSIQLFASVFLTGFLESILDIPEQYTAGATFLIGSVCFTSIMASVLIPFNSIIFSHRFLFLLSLKDCIQVLVRFLGVMVLFSLFDPSLSLVGIALLCSSSIAALTTLSIGVAVDRNSISFGGKFQSKVATNLLMKSRNVLIGQIGLVIIMSSDLLLLNLFAGPEISGHYAAAGHWAFAARALAIALSSVGNPDIFHLCAGGDWAKTMAYIQRMMRLLSLVLAYPAGMLAAIAPGLLSTWLDPSFAANAPVLSLLSVIMIPSFAAMPGFNVALFQNATMTPALVSLGLALTNIVGCIILLIFTPAGAFGVALLTSLTMMARNLFCGALYPALLTKNAPTFLLSSLLLLLIYVPLSYALGMMTAAYLQPKNLIEYALLMTALGPIYVVIAFAFLPSSDQKFLRTAVLFR